MRNFNYFLVLAFSLSLCFSYTSISSAEMESPKTIPVQVINDSENQEAQDVRDTMLHDPFDDAEEDLFDSMNNSFERMNQMHQRMLQQFSNTGMQNLSMQDEGNEAGYSYTETEDNVLLHCYLPGVSKGSLKVDIQDGQVQVSGSNKSHLEKEEDNGQGAVHVVSSSQSSFFRSFPLHDQADPLHYQVKTQKNEVIIEFEKKK